MYLVFPDIVTVILLLQCLSCKTELEGKHFWYHYDYSRVWNKHTPTLIKFLTFFQGLWPYSGLHRAYLSSISIRYKWGYAYSFCQIYQGICLFNGVRLFQTLEYGYDNHKKKTRYKIGPLYLIFIRFNQNIMLLLFPIILFSNINTCKIDLKQM